jgi:hypothetical protein
MILGLAVFTTVYEYGHTGFGVGSKVGVMNVSVVMGRLLLNQDPLPCRSSRENTLKLSAG